MSYEVENLKPENQEKAQEIIDLLDYREIWCRFNSEESIQLDGNFTKQDLLNLAILMERFV